MQSTFLDTFLTYVGESECPVNYFRWAALAGIAACLSNRVHTRRRIGNEDIPIYPNLYTILVGPSGNYKSFASQAILRLLNSLPQFPAKVNRFHGRLTAQAMYEQMRKEVTREDGTKEIRDNAGQLFLAFDELALSTGEGERADVLFKSLIGMFNGIPLDEATRTRGAIRIEDYIINLLACSTEDLMQTVITPVLIKSGLARRLCVVRAGYSTIRIYEGKRPDNYEALQNILKARLAEILEMKGSFVLTKEAVEAHRLWYNSRPQMNQDETASNWLEQPTLSLKLALLSSVNRYGEPHIMPEDIEFGIKNAEQIGLWLGEVLPGLLGPTPTSQIVLRYIQRKDTVSRTDLIRFCNRRPVCWHKDELDKWIRNWRETGDVHEVVGNGREPTTYTYTGKGMRS